MTKFEYIFIFTFFLISNYKVSALDSALSHLKHYEVISQLPSTRSKRNVLGIKTINLRAYGRAYTLHLKRANSILTDDFYVSTMDGKGHIQNHYNIREPEPYEGFVAGDESSSVTAYFDDSNSMTAIIETANDTIMIERLSRYDEELSPTNESMIIYRQSDLKIDPSKNKSMCAQAIPPKPSKVTENKETNDKKSHTRSKRSIPGSKNTCELLLVADYRFHKKYGRGNKVLTSNYLIELIGRINRIYRKTEFTTEEGATLTNYGFSIKHIIIHGEPSSSSETYRYNQELPGPDAWETERLLKEFGRVNYGEYCLAHLFTYQQFTQGILGLAWIASPSIGNPGGICTKGEFLSDATYYLNTGWTTFKDGAGKSLLTLMAHLVTAHEFGHNWGSNHDPDNEECSPPSDQSGKYIMYTYSVSGYEQNNKLFSPCSKRAMGAVLNSRAFHCFSSESKSEKFCGNKRTDDGEECDAGTEGDECCTSNCQLHRNATCSKFNSRCCTDMCQPSPAGTICAEADEENPCEGESRCTGDLSTCPAPKRNDFKNCAEHGTCSKGRCHSFCEYQGMRSCICDKVEDSCLICCLRNNSSCLPTDKLGYSRLQLNDGRPCLIGVCDGGKCLRRVNKLVERFWDIINQLHPNAFGVFLKNNLVCAVIFFSLIVWIPGCFIVWWADTKENKEKMNEKEKEDHYVAVPSYWPGRKETSI